jgi:hypothetical protein
LEGVHPGDGRVETTHGLDADRDGIGCERD